MDSRSESDGHEDNEEVTLPLLHGAGDGSNGSTGRPGLEGANSDVEDLPVQSGPPLDASTRQETQGIGLCVPCTVHSRALLSKGWTMLSIG